MTDRARLAAKLNLLKTADLVRYSIVQLSPPLLADVTAEFSQADQPIAVGTFNVVFFFGGEVGAAISTAIVQQGYALDIFAAWRLPAYTTAELLLCVAPLVAAIAAMRRSGGAGSGPTG